jgi:hypothetical protein
LEGVARSDGGGREIATASSARLAKIVNVAFYSLAALIYGRIKKTRINSGDSK